MIQRYQDKAGKHRWRLKAKNGEPVAQGQAYPTKQHLDRGIATFFEAARDAFRVFGSGVEFVPPVEQSEALQAAIYQTIWATDEHLTELGITRAEACQRAQELLGRR